MLGMIGEEFTTNPVEIPFEASPGDLIFYTFPDGRPAILPGTIPIECGIGYDRPGFGAWRVFESEAWRHFHFGKYPSTLLERRQSWVLPWAFDPDFWPLGTGGGGYVAMLTRLALDKGLAMFRDVAIALPNQEFKIAGVGTFPSGMPHNVQFVGAIHGKERAKFLADAIALMVPTEYTEPFGGVAIEAMLCGTPALTSNFGGFTETIIDEVSGRLCFDSADFIDGIERAKAFNRGIVRNATADRFSLESISERWERALPKMRSLPWAV